MWIEPQALRQFKELQPGKTLNHMKTMVKRSAPVTHASGNRRYQELVFRLVENKVVSVAPYNVEGCPDCDGRGFTFMYDDFEKRQVAIPCQTCKKGESR